MIGGATEALQNILEQRRGGLPPDILSTLNQLQGVNERRYSADQAARIAALVEALAPSHGSQPQPMGYDEEPFNPYLEAVRALYEQRPTPYGPLGGPQMFPPGYGESPQAAYLRKLRGM